MDPRNIEPPTWREFTSSLTWGVIQLVSYVTIIIGLLLILVVHAGTP